MRSKYVLSTAFLVNFDFLADESNVHFCKLTYKLHFNYDFICGFECFGAIFESLIRN